MTQYRLPVSIETKAVHHGRILVIGVCDRVLRIQHKGEHWDNGYEIPYQAIYALGETLKKRRELAKSRRRKAASKKANRRAAKAVLRWGLSLLTTFSGWLYYHAVFILTAKEDEPLRKNLESKFPVEAPVIENFSSDVVGGLRGLGCGKRDAVAAVKRAVERGVGVREFESLFRAALGEVRGS